MKKFVEPLSETTLSLYPIKDLVEGWHFKMNEISNGAYRIEGIDRWGHSVSRVCSEFALDETLRLCAKDANEIDAQLRQKNK
jgi:hypothetical protein